ncbi:MAG TPA: cytochrome c [Anaerolineales bacterium]|nr:cytochrome c [Anaerolineales bacterium]
MKKAVTLVAAAAGIIVLVLLAGCGGSESSGGTDGYSAEVVEHGQTLFNQTCFTCHGPDGKGIPNLGKDLTASEFVAQSSDADLLEYVKVGRPANDPANTTGIAMPPKGGFDFLTDDDIEAIIAYIRTDLQQ